MGGFFSGAMGVLGPRIEEAHRIDQEQKASERQSYLDASKNAAAIAFAPPGANDPLTGQPYTDERKAKAKSDYDLFNTEYQKRAGGPKIVKQIFSKLNGIVDHVHNGANGGNQPGQPPAEASPGGGQGATGAPAPPQSSIPPPPAASAAPAAGASSATIPPPPGDVRARALAYGTPAQPSPEATAVTNARAAAAGHGALIKALDADLAKIDADPNLDDDQKSEKRRVLTLSYGLQPRTQLKESTALTKGADIPDFEAKGLKPDVYYRRMFNPVNGDTVSYHPASAPMGQIRAINSPITPESAREAVAAGKKFLDESGKEIDVAALKPFQKLTPVETNRGVHYIVGNQASRYVTFGNEVHELPALGQIGIPGQPAPAGVTAVGAKQVPVASTREVPMVDPTTGRMTKETLRSTRTPMTSGGSRLTAPPGSPGTTPAAGGGAPSASDKPSAMPQAMFNAQVKRATPIRAAAVQIVGDPDSPDFKPLESYASLADNKESRERVAGAWRVIKDELGKTEHKYGQLGTVLSNMVGLPSILANTTTGVVEKALAKLTPQEKDLLDREIAAYGSIIGLRTITGGSAAKFSADSIERELPIIGVNANSSRQFYNKLSSLFEEIKGGSENISPDVLKQKPMYREAAKRLSSLAKGQPSNESKLTPPPSGGTVQMKGPDGSIWAIPSDKVEAAKKKGAVAIQ